MTYRNSGVSGLADLLTTGGAARVLHISENMIRRLAAAGRLPSEVTPYGRLYRVADVERLAGERAERKGRAQ